MKFPSFEEFEDTLTLSQVEAWSDAANSAKINITYPLNENNINEFITSLSSTNLIICKAMLQDYHSWLSERLDRCFSHQD